jgi:hypothetical protein
VVLIRKRVNISAVRAGLNCRRALLKLQIRDVREQARNPVLDKHRGDNSTPASTGGQILIERCVEPVQSPFTVPEVENIDHV